MFKSTDNEDVEKAKVASEEEAFNFEQKVPSPGGGDPLAFDLIFFPTAEGFYDYENKRYIYQYKDHLGNVRMSYTKNTSSPNNVATVLDRNTYYAFGMNQLSEMSASLYTPLSSAFNYKYSGKELQETGMYDFGWRHYMPDIGRWNGMDQLAEKYMPISPYAYVANNPISLIDPDGRKITPIKDKDGNITGWTFTGDDAVAVGAYLGSKDGSFDNLFTQLNSYDGNFGSGPLSNFWSNFNTNGTVRITYTETGPQYDKNSLHEARIISTTLDKFLKKLGNSKTIKYTNVTGVFVNEGERRLTKAVEARQGTYLTTGKTTVENGKLRTLNTSTYKWTKVTSRSFAVVGYATTLADIHSDLKKGNNYTAVTRIAVNVTIGVIGAACPICGFGLSVLEATAGDILYDYVETNFD